MSCFRNRIQCGRFLAGAGTKAANEKPVDAEFEKAANKITEELGKPGGFEALFGHNFGKAQTTSDGSPASTGLITYRVKCSACGKVQNAKRNYVCQQCGCSQNVDINNHGFLQLYRMGNYMGMASPESIYLNGEGMGMIGNTETVVIELAPGVYNLHVAMNILRNCEDIMVKIEPGKTVYVKSQLKMGMIKNKIVLFEVSASEMPPIA